MTPTVPLETERWALKIVLDTYTVLRIVYDTSYMADSKVIDQELFENLRLELRRGCLVLAVLAALHGERYGYTLRKELAEHGMEMDEGTLYPLLRRLEAQGLLVSQWREEDRRKKRFYRLSPAGKLMLKQLLAEWKTMDVSLNAIFQEI